MLLRDCKTVVRDFTKSCEIKTETSGVRKWTFEENKLYVQFLKDNKKLLEYSSARRSSKIFLEMSMHMQTKTPEQCRTHHQKIMGKYSKIEKIISSFIEDLSIKQQKSIIWEEKEKNSFYSILKDQMNFKINLCLNELQEW